MGFGSSFKKVFKKAKKTVKKAASQTVSNVKNAPSSAFSTAKSLSRSPIVAAIGPIAPGALAAYAGRLPGFVQSAKPLISGAADIAEKVPYLTKEGRSAVAAIHGPRAIAGLSTLIPGIGAFLDPILGIASQVPILGDLVPGATTIVDGGGGGAPLGGAAPFTASGAVTGRIPTWAIVAGVVGGATVIYLALRKR